ncbi:uncharacterized protein LOC142045331 [Buteo buteo]|uniref:uncharacterized protein LOC142045331 n=1 Tax=Buteo buteo TaxID=30397 RepID=UPI003EB8123D
MGCPNAGKALHFKEVSPRAKAEAKSPHGPSSTLSCCCFGPKHAAKWICLYTTSGHYLLTGKRMQNHPANRYCEVLWSHSPVFPVPPGPIQRCSVCRQVLSIPVSPARSPCSPSEDVLGIAAALSRPPHAAGSTPLPSDAAFQIAKVKLGFAQKPLVSMVQSRAQEPECGHAAVARSSSHLQLQTPLPKSTEVPDRREGGSRHRYVLRPVGFL